VAPPRTSDDPGTWVRAAECLPERASSHRSHANQTYILNAMGVLGLGTSDPDGPANRKAFGWLIGVEGDDPDWVQKIRLRRTILTELGRIPDDNALRSVAATLCREKPKRARDAVSLVRRWRLGSDDTGKAEALEDELVRLVNDYLRRGARLGGGTLVIIER
jgi:hypothetical protein